MLSQPRSGDGEGATARYGVSVGVSVITLEGDQHTDIIGAGTVCTDGETRYGQRVHHISIGLHSRKILGEGLLIPVVLGYSELDHGILQIPIINVCTGGSHLYGSILLAACGDRIKLEVGLDVRLAAVLTILGDEQGHNLAVLYNGLKGVIAVADGVDAGGIELIVLDAEDNNILRIGVVGGGAILGQAHGTIGGLLGAHAGDVVVVPSWCHSRIR